MKLNYLRYLIFLSSHHLFYHICSDTEFNDETADAALTNGTIHCLLKSQQAPTPYAYQVQHKYL